MMLRESRRLARLSGKTLGSLVSKHLGQASCTGVDACVRSESLQGKQDYAGTKSPITFAGSDGVGARALREIVQTGVVVLGRIHSFSLVARSSDMDDRMNSSPGCASVLAPSFIAKNSIQTRYLSSSTDKPGQVHEKKNLSARIGSLLSDLEDVPFAALGLGLAGAIPFVGLAPGISSVLPLPDSLYNVHIEAQAAYGAVILTFLGGPHWGLAMTNYGVSPNSDVSRVSAQSLRYVWSVVPSLVGWLALLLSPVPKFAVLITSYGLVLGVDAMFTRWGLLPSWYMPLRVLLTSIAMLSMTSSLVVSAAVDTVTAITQ